MTLAPPERVRPPSPEPLPAPGGGPVPHGLRATARITARAGADGVTGLPVLDGEGPIALRRVRSYGTQARVCVVGAMSAPLGGDRLRVEVTAEDGADLCVTAAAATVALPGRVPGHATYDVELTVGEGARLAWLPEPLISAEGSDLRMTTTVHLAATARLVLREEQVLGRSGERTGRLRSRLTVHHAGRTLLDQETAYGPGAPGWDTGAVLGGHRAVGQLLFAGPELEAEPARVRVLGSAPDEGQGVRTPLAGPATLTTAVAPDALRVRRLLEAGAVAE